MIFVFLFCCLIRRSLLGLEILFFFSDVVVIGFTRDLKKKRVDFCENFQFLISG